MLIPTYAYLRFKLYACLVFLAACPRVSDPPDSGVDQNGSPVDQAVGAPRDQAVVSPRDQAVGSPQDQAVGSPQDQAVGQTVDQATGTGNPSLHATQASGRYFPNTAPWYVDISQAPKAADSDAITAYMVNTRPPAGWGNGTMQVEFSIPVIDVPAGTTKLRYQTVSGYYYVPDCDLAPLPLPAGGLVEDYPTPARTTPFSGYTCSGFANGADCHILLLSRAEQRLYEIYHATINADGSNFRGGCLAIWDLRTTSPNGRGQQCTSADAAGFSIAALLFTADEIQAGVIDHAIRFVLPNNFIRARKYVSPATHGTNTTGPATTGPYGFRMRLKANYPVGNLSPAAQVVARAMQKYGMLMADGGNVALNAQNDTLSQVKWSGVGFNANSLSALKATDFEVIDYGTPIDVTNNCTRTQIIE